MSWHVQEHRMLVLLLLTLSNGFINGLVEVSNDYTDFNETEDFYRITDEDILKFEFYRQQAKSINSAYLYNVTTDQETRSKLRHTYEDALVTRAPRVSQRSARQYEAYEVVGKTPEQLIKLRGFGVETHLVETPDGYYIHVVRIINPKLDKKRKLKRPVIFNHGLFESSTIWLINSKGVKPSDYVQDCGKPIKFTEGTKQTQTLNGPMMLANAGYDVWLMSMRGTDFSLKHDKYDHEEDMEFWQYSLDQFGLVDVPSVVNYVRELTKKDKVGYIGHSQATFSIFALLAKKPEFANVISPVIAVAPVSHFKHMTSISRIFLKGALLLTPDTKNGPFPMDAKFFRRFNYDMCNYELIPTLNCQLLNTFIAGSGRYWPKGYYAHIPFYTSYQVLRHFGQMLESKKFQMYDFGPEKNNQKYGVTEAPEYHLSRIESKSIYLFSAENDLLSTPSDVEVIASELKYGPAANIAIKGNYNHFDLITATESSDLVNKPILSIFENEANNKGCPQDYRMIMKHRKRGRRKKPSRVIKRIDEIQKDP